MADDGIEFAIAKFRAALAGNPDLPMKLLGVAELAANKKLPVRAMEIVREAMAMAPNDPAVTMRARRILSGLLPGYHVPMMNDARRNAAWDRALRRAIKPGMHVLEIGTGAGMLALMAARAGAEKVITCEKHPVVAALARELVARNGYSDRVTVIEKESAALEVGVDLERPADLLFCDIFADDFFNFDPLPAIADARARLVAPGAPSVPAFGGVCVALAHWDDFARSGQIATAAGFDTSLMTDFISPLQLRMAGDAGVRLLSDDVQLFRFDLVSPVYSPSGAAQSVCTVRDGGTANAIARWIRLELDDETVLQAKPEAGAVFFSAPRLTPLPEPMAVRAGERHRIGGRYHGKTNDVWLTGRD